MEDIIAKSNLNWEIVRPGMLNNGPLTNHYEVLSILSKGMKVGKISRNDVADFLVQEAKNPQLIHKYVALTN